MSIRSAALVVAFAAVACGGAPEASDDANEEASESELRNLRAGTFATTEEPGGQLDPIGCRHYMGLELATNARGPHAVVTWKLDAEDPSFMDSDGSCGGQETTKAATDYPLAFVSRSRCGASTFEGTIKWTPSGAVTRTMRLTDYRGSKCADKPARVVAEITSRYQGETNTIGTYYSVDPMR